MRPSFQSDLVEPSVDLNRPRRVEISDHDARQVLIAAHRLQRSCGKAERRRIEEFGWSPFLHKSIQAYANIEDDVRVDRIRVVDVATVVGAKLKSARDRKVVNYAGPVLTIFRIEAVIVLAEDRLVRTDAMIDARQPAAIILMSNLVREEVVLCSVCYSCDVRQRIEFDQVRSDRIDQRWRE